MAPEKKGSLEEATQRARLHAREAADIIRTQSKAGRTRAVLFAYNTRASQTEWVRWQGASATWSDKTFIDELRKPLEIMASIIPGNMYYAVTVDVPLDGEPVLMIHTDINPEIGDAALLILGQQLFGIEPANSYEAEELEKALKQERTKETLVYACYQNDEEAARQRLARATPKSLNQKLKLIGTPLHAACMNGNTTMARLLVEAGADRESTNFMKYTPLLAALNKGDEDMALLLLELGADPLKTGAQAMSALALAIVAKMSESVLRLLVDKGCQVNHMLSDKRSLLELAASCNNIPALRFLLANGIDSSFLDSALSAACWWGNAPETMKVLMQAGGNLAVAFTKNKIILYNLGERPAMVAWLADQGLDFDARPAKAVKLYHYKEYRFKGSPREWFEECGHTAALWALDNRS